MVVGLKRLDYILKTRLKAVNKAQVGVIHQAIV